MNEKQELNACMLYLAVRMIAVVGLTSKRVQFEIFLMASEKIVSCDCFKQDFIMSGFVLSCSYFKLL